MNQFKMAFLTLTAASSLVVVAIDVPTELEKPGMDEDTVAAIQAFATNPCPDTVEMIRASVSSNYDAVVARKIAKLHELDGTSGTGTAAKDQSVVAISKPLGKAAPEPLQRF